jgi:signal recognition particle GTPase
MDQQPELLQKLSEGNFTLRIMYEQFQNILKMGPIGQVTTLLYLRMYYTHDFSFDWKDFGCCC